MGFAAPSTWGAMAKVRARKQPPVVPAAADTAAAAENGGGGGGNSSGTVVVAGYAPDGYAPEVVRAAMPWAKSLVNMSVFDTAAARTWSFDHYNAAMECLRAQQGTVGLVIAALRLHNLVVQFTQAPSRTIGQKMVKGAYATWICHQAVLAAGQRRRRRPGYCFFLSM